MAAGAVPARMASARTLLLELDPRPDGITRIRPSTRAPAWGWRPSTIVPVAGSTPPHRESGWSRRRAVPRAVPSTRVRLSAAGPAAVIPPHPPFHRRAHALLEAADHHLDPDVAGR